MKLYNELIEICKEAGVPVRHRKKGDDGGYFPDERRIYINSNLRETMEGLYVLVHEMGHAIDHAGGRHVKFFEFAGKIRFNRVNWLMIRRAEISASSQGIKILKQSGIKLYPKRLTNSVLDIAINPSTKTSKTLFENWKRDYFLECK